MAVRPAKLLQVVITDITPNATWTENDGGNDLGTDKAYKWDVTMSVTVQSHSSHEHGSDVPFFYNGEDIAVGDYICSSNKGDVLKIVFITSQSNDVCVCVAEDEHRLNTYQDNTQLADGTISQDDGFIFEVKNGTPILFPTPDVFPGSLIQAFGTQLFSRFAYREAKDTIHIEQASHGLVVGDAVYLASNGSYAKVDLTDTTKQTHIGTVVEIGVPGVNYFRYRPIGSLVNLAMPGTADVGGLVYISDSAPGTLTGTKPTSNIIMPVFIKVSTTSGILHNGGGGGSGTSVITVANITERDILASSEGQLVLVADTGGGEWALYIYTSSAWQIVTTEDTSGVDAKTVSVNLAHNSSATLAISNIGGTSRVTSIAIIVGTTFNGSPSLIIGDSGDNDRLMTANEIDLKTVDTYIATPVHLYSSGSDQAVNAYYTAGGANTGSATILLTYV
jgi:hypothetical protein